MSTDRDKMYQAKALIEQKKYREAKVILLQVNHPKAQEWLDKIQDIELAGDPFAGGGAAKPSRLPLVLGVVAAIF